MARGNAKQEHTPLDADARSEIDDDLVSRTDTDPVRDAFNEALELNEDNDNDEILYLRRVPFLMNHLTCFITTLQTCCVP